MHFLFVLCVALAGSSAIHLQYRQYINAPGATPTEYSLIVLLVHCISFGMLLRAFTDPRVQTAGYVVGVGAVLGMAAMCAWGILSATASAIRAAVADRSVPQSMGDLSSAAPVQDDPA